LAIRRDIEMEREVPVAIELELEPLGLDLEKGPGEDQAAVQTALGKRNRVRLGAPRWTNYVAELRAEGALPTEVEHEVRTGYDFRRVQLSLTLLPDRGCIFLAVELSVELLGMPRDGSNAAVIRPMAYMVGPPDVLYPVQYRETSRAGYNVGGEAGAGLAKLLAKFTEENSVEREGVRYVRERYTYGLNTSEVGWRLQAGGAAPLEGDVRDLEFVARVPTQVRLAGRFHVAADIGIKAAVDRWLTRAFGPRADDEALDVVYPLGD
jgi:hypothetical protein